MKEPGARSLILKSIVDDGTQVSVSVSMRAFKKVNV